MIRYKVQKEQTYYIGERYYKEHKASMESWLDDKTISAHEFISSIYPLLNEEMLKLWLEESWVMI